MKDATLDQFLGDFVPSDSSREQSSMQKDLVSIRLTPDAKARWDKLQEMSRKQFGKKAREVILALIEAAESRVKSA